ncbi:MAG: Gfo/Idh/MocA family oxidoreductase [Magnetococcales bacterium]|nr:Gfo/Idh/MocA family oxidoreductase [Magnetococcales bacterium]
MQNAERSSSTPLQPTVCVIGAGYWGKNLIRNFHQLGALRLICDSSEETLTRFRDLYPDVEASSAISAAFDRSDIDAVVISTPAVSHFSLARQALLAGKHVFCEKPLVLVESEAKVLIQLAEQRGLKLMVGHLMHYHAAFQRLKQMVLDGELGKINYIYSHRLHLGKIRREENILWSFAPHDISMILSLVGEVPESVLATGGNFISDHIADVTTSHLFFKSGVQAQIFVSWLHPFKEQRLVVVGEKKMAVLNDTLPWSEKLVLYPHEVQWKDYVPIASSAEPELVNVPECEPLKTECQHFLETIQSDKEAVTSGREGLRVLEVLNRCQQSLQNSGERVVVQQDAEPESVTEPQLESVPKSEGAPKRAESDVFVHESAVVDEGVTLGTGCKIWHFSHVMPGSTIGERVSIGQNVVVGPDATIGDGCKIQNNVSVYKGVTLEEDVFCGPSMVFTNVHNPRAHIKRMDELRPTRVCKGASLGANSTIVCGTTIGRYAFVGAGAVVTKDVPDHALVVGNPARISGWICSCGTKLDASLVCEACGSVFARRGRTAEEGVSGEGNENSASEAK